MDERRLERLLAALHGTAGDASVLDRICAVCARTTDLDGAGLSRIHADRHEVLAVSSRDAEAIEEIQVALAEGPCLDAVARARPALEPDLASADARARWPRFTVAAIEQGIAAVFAFPLLQRGAAVGALDVYSRAPGALRTEAYEDAVVLADLASLAVARFDSSPGIAAAGIAAEATEPWAFPAVVHQASGMIAEQLGVDVDEALLRLRAWGFVSGAAVSDLARDVVARRVRIESWSSDD